MGSGSPGCEAGEGDPGVPLFCLFRASSLCRPQCSGPPKSMLANRVEGRLLRRIKAITPA